MASTVYEEFAACFAAEGTRTVFGLMGDGNMHWSVALRDSYGATFVHTRHEHTAVAAAMGHWSATGEVGVASVTCGPGFTQILTALTSAARGTIPLVVFAGEAPLSARYYHQRLDQAPIATLCGAHYIAAHSPDLVHHYVREAFYTARHQRKPVVIGVPYDLQKRPFPAPADYLPSTSYTPRRAPVPPAPEEVAQVAALLAAAKRPVIVGGRGVLASDGALPLIERLAARTGALLANTLPTRGLFDADPYSLGVIGGYTMPDLMPLLAGADLIVSFGASFGFFTQASGTLFPAVPVVKVGLDNEGMRQGLKSGDLHLYADAALTARALLEALPGPDAAGYRSPAMARRLATREAPGVADQPAPGTLNPYAVVRALESVIPKDWDVVCGTGHQAWFHTEMRGYDPRRYHHMRDFGAVGNSLPQAIGVAAARRDGRVVLFEGDGSLMMYAQEFETLRRSGLKLLVICSNDGGYAAEFHKLRVDGLPDDIALHGRTDIAAAARGFGLAGAVVTDTAAFARLMEDYLTGDTAAIWDVQVSDRIINPAMQRSLGLLKIPAPADA